jgi:1-deoxy-D-xylulose-5-phosphate synthase
LRFLKPLDKSLLHEVFSTYDEIITVEDGVVTGGMGSALVEFMNENGYQSQITMLGIADEFVLHGKPEELYNMCGFDTSGILKAIRHVISTKVEHSKK